MPHYVLDGHKLNWHMDRVRAWEAGERIAPITMDVSLHSGCNYRCQFCAARYQTGVRAGMPRDRVALLLEDAAGIGVRGMAFMSDGESTLNPCWAEMVGYGKKLGLDMAAASNGYLLTPELAERALPHLTYLRINFSAGESRRYSEIMGVPEAHYWHVVDNIMAMVEMKRRHKWAVTIGLCMVLRPQDADQIVPFAELGKALGVDYAIVKHCIDYDQGQLGVDFAAYAQIKPLIRQAEALSTADYLVTAKWGYIEAGGTESCEKCYGPPFLLQASGMGLVAACGPLFAPRYAEKFHIGNLNETRLRDLWESKRYWEVMGYLRSDEFTRTRPCRKYLCVQRNLNEALDKHLRGELRLREPNGGEPQHINFI